MTKQIPPALRHQLHGTAHPQEGFNVAWQIRLPNRAPQDLLIVQVPVQPVFVPLRTTHVPDPWFDLS